MAGVELRGVSKVYADGTQAVDSIDLVIDDGEFMVLVGPSGCGKTTVLRMVGGLEGISAGELSIGGQVVNELGPRERDIAMVFQNYALYPHMSVYENIAFPLRAQRESRAEVKSRVEGTAKLLGLEKQLRRKPRHLSGGQRQRVAMGRALVRQPQVFLMDEPLSNLDASLRTEMRAEIINLQQELGVTTLYVTHDQVEAMTMGHRIAVLRDGVLQQEGAPQQVYAEPANLFVARFIGSPPMNLFRATLDVADGRAVCRLEQGELRLPEGYLEANSALAAYRGRELAVGVRPEHLQDARIADPQRPRLRAEVTLVETLGAERQVHLRMPGKAVLTRDILDVVRDFDAPAVEELAAGAENKPARAVARFEADAEVRVGDTLELAVVADKLRFFDLDSGVAIRQEVGNA